MKSVIMSGGLGNQMFQYALVLALRSRNFKVSIDTSYYDFVKMHNGYELEHVFGVHEHMVNKQGFHILWLRWLNKFRPKCLYVADTLQYDSGCIVNPKKYIWGYWQDERYFKGIESKVRTTFQFRGIDEFNMAIAHEMKSKDSISFHVRRGDYAAFGMNLIGDDYYQKAIKYIKRMIETPFFYIFSDDVSVAKNLADKMGISYKLISHNMGDESYKDMFLMSQCKHNILANSSFSWWGAWLNGNDKKIVIAPKEWNAANPICHPQADGWLLF